MPESKTTGELRKAALITDDAINAAVDAVLATPDTGAYDLGGGYTLDLAAAIAAHGPARETLARVDARAGWRRTMARTAILMARPEKA